MSASPRTAASALTMRAQLGEDALLGGTRPAAARARGRRRTVSASISKPSSVARRATRSVRRGSAANALGAHHPQPPALEVAGAAVRIDELAAGQRLGHRVDRQVARGEVGLERAALQRGEVDLPAAVAGDHAPGAELVGELERGAARAAAEAAGGAAHVAVDDDVEVGRRAAQQPVAQRAADEPGALAGQRLAQRLDHNATPSRWYARGTRAVSAHVIS